MKKYFLLTCLITSMIWSSSKPFTYVLSVQHSGSMWTLYSLHSLTHRPVFDCNSNPLYPNCKMHSWHHFYKYQNTIDETKSPIYFSHSPDRFYGADLPVNINEDKLLIVVRNYKECFMSLKRSPNQMMSDIQSKKPHQFMRNLITNLSLYQKWNPKKRLLIYYEDLMTNPERSFEKMLTFLDEKPHELENYTQDLSRHKKHCLHLYKTNKIIKGFANTKSNGETIAYTKNIPLSRLQALDKLFKERYPNLWPFFQRFAS